MSDPSILPQSWHDAVATTMAPPRHSSSELSSQYTRLLQHGNPGSAVYLDYLARKKQWLISGALGVFSEPHPLWESLIERLPPDNSSWRFLGAGLSLGLAHMQDNGILSSSMSLWQTQLMAFHDLVDLANHPKLSAVRLEMIEHIVSNFTDSWMIDSLLDKHASSPIIQSLPRNPRTDSIASTDVLRALCEGQPSGSDFAHDKPLFINLLSKMNQSRRCLNLMHTSCLYHLSFISAVMHQHGIGDEDMAFYTVIKAVREGMINSPHVSSLKAQLIDQGLYPLPTFPTSVLAVGVGLSNVLTAPPEYWEMYRTNTAEHKGVPPRGSYPEFEEYLDNRISVEEDLIGLNDICLHLQDHVMLPPNVGRLLDVDEDYRFIYRALAARWDKQALMEQVPNTASSAKPKKI